MRRGARILVVDDSATVRKVVEIAMRGTGCEVDLAATGADGVARARAHRPDVLLLDYLLPDMRSVEVCERLRADAMTRGLPIILMSANQRGVLDEFRALPAVIGFVAKPFTASEIQGRLDAALRAHARIPDPDLAPAPPTATTGAPAEPELALRGDLAVTPLLEVLRLLAASRATGTLVVDIDLGAAARLSLRRGELVMATSSAAPAPTGPLPPALRERVARNLADGKPALVTLAEAGAGEVSRLPLDLHAASVQLLGELLDARAGRFTWQPALALADFVEAFGRSVSLTALALDRARRSSPATSGPDAREPRDPRGLDRLYDRAPQFSQQVAGTRLDPEDQRVLAAIDGPRSARDLAGRAGLAPERALEILARLGAARLVCEVHAARSGVRTVAVLDADRDEFIAPLRARLGRRASPIAVVELDPEHALAAATLAASADLVLIGASALTRHVIDREIPILARGGAVAVVGVLEAPDPALTRELLHAGLHAVVAKPVHINELELLLSA